MRNKKKELFELRGELKFYAKDLRDAFKIVGEHYLKLMRLTKGEDRYIEECDITILPATNNILQTSVMIQIIDENKEDFIKKLKEYD